MNIRICCTALITLLSGFSLSAQDFSNKGKDFWVGYGYHVRYVSGNPVNGQEMVLYFATDAVTTIKVEIPALGYSQTYSNIAANTIYTTAPLPKAGPQDARLANEGISNKGVHITSDKPVVAYAHIYNQSVSGATLLFPTTTLGKEYYSINFDQRSNEENSNCFFYAVAVDTGTTTIEVIPSANTQTMIAGNIYTYNLTQGQVFNALGTESGTAGVDLTGSKIRSISSGSGSCKRIAVFSGSGKIQIRCATNPNSADNYMVQAFPKNAWGKYYLTVPTQNQPFNYYRIAVSDPTTVVKFNGVIMSGLINSFYYQVGPNNTPNVVEADKPIMVAQYITTTAQCGNSPLAGNGDPEMIYLSPVEQNIDKVILNSTPNFQISTQHHYINVSIPNRGTALGSFTIDGLPPSSQFIVHPGNPNYSYLVENVRPGQHTIQSDSGFNAIAYGYGVAESYGYNAGANIKDLYQFVSVQNQYATVNFPAACRSSPFFFSMTFPYQPTQIQWLFNGLFPDVTVSAPVFDSTWVVNGKQLYRYKLTAPYTIVTSGTYPIKVLAQNPTPDGCSGEQEINYDLQVFDPPGSDFTFTNNGCISDSVRFLDNANTGGRPVISYSWNFGDGNTSSVKNPAHLYTGPGSFTVKHSVVTDVGCLSDTTEKIVALSPPPAAKFGASFPDCIGKLITFTDSSTATSSSIVKWYWDFGDGSPQVVATTNAAQTHTYNTAGNYNVTLRVETSTGCLSNLFTKALIINVFPLAAFNFGGACLPGGLTQFTNTSTISDGTQSGLTYVWDFGDGNNSTIQNPSNNYASAGPFNVTLTVTSNNGCIDDTMRVMNTIFEQPVAAFNAPAEACFGSTLNFIDASSAANSTITQWQWNFGDGNTSNQRNPNHNYAAPGTYTVTLTTTSAVGCPSTTATKNVIVNPLPTTVFNFSAPSCATRDITFTDNSATGAGNINKWDWNMGDGTTFSKTTAAPFVHSYANTGVYTVTLRVETDKGCISTLLSRQVTVSPLPVPSFGMPENCLSDPFSQFSDSSTIADGTESGFTYLWNFGDPNANGGNPNTSTLKNPQHKYTLATTYNVSLTVTSNNGCSNSVTQQFLVNGAIPQSAFTVQGSTEHCSDDDVIITNNSFVDVGNIIKLEVFWDYANDPTNKITDNTPSAGSSYTFRYPEFFAPVSKTYTITVVAYSGDNCLSSTTQIITVKARPQLRFDPLASVCADVTPFQITGTGIQNGLPGTGIFSGTGVSSTGLFNPAVAGSGVHTIRYTFNADNGCSKFIEQTINVFEIPTADAGPDRVVLEGGFVTLVGAGTGPNLSYLWTPATGLNNPAIAKPASSPTDDITYTFRVTTSDGCTDTDQVFVKLLKTPIIPNTFSPNRDGIHDKWEINYLESYPGATVQIYNRYGQLIFESKGYSKPWDGMYKGKDAPAGTYYYIIDPKNGRIQLTGFVDIIR